MTANQAFYRQISALLQQGNASDAEDRLRAWLNQNPGDEIGLSLLGSALLKLDRTSDAVNVFREAATRHPGSFAAHGDLGYACMRAGDMDGAVDALERAVGLNSRFYQGWCYLSRLRFEQADLAGSNEALRRADDCDPLSTSFREVQEAMSASQFARAEKLCRGLLKRQPGYPRAAYGLAHLASKVGAHEEASAILERALGHYPADVNLRAALVISHEESGLYDKALVEAATISEIKPDVHTSWLILGRVHGHCGNYAEALQSYDRALALCGDSLADAGNTELLRGHILKILGRYDDGIAAYRSSIGMLPGNGAGWWGLADMKTHRFDDDDIAAMTAIAGDESVTPAQRAQATFALAKALEDRGQYTESFERYQAGNSLRSGIVFDPDALRAGIEEISRAFDARVLATQAEPRPQGAIPIFIVGLPRAGSTLIEQILASHSQVEGTMELATLPNLVRRIMIEGGRKNVEYPSSMATFSAAQLSSWGEVYLDQTAMYRTGKPLFIDKLPTNFDKIGLIHKILPSAIVIDARRHPLDCGLSCYKQHFAGGHAFSYSLEHIGHYYNAYLAMMDHWDRVLPGKVLCVRYEELVADTEAAVRALLAHCGVPYEASCLRFFENKRPVRTASSEQVRRPIYRKGVGHWKHFASELEPLKQALGEQTLARFDRF
ncbi:MAG: sulfotransferase [Woeseia sp.]